MFRDLSPSNPAFSGWAGVSRGLAVGDIDGDGALDLLVTQVGGPARLLQKRRPPPRPLAAGSRRGQDVGGAMPIGAEVRVEAGGRHWERVVQPGSSYLCSNDPRAHFGLGDAVHITVVRLVGPMVPRRVFPGGEVDHALVLRQGQGQTVTGAKEPGP